MPATGDNKRRIGREYARRNKVKIYEFQKEWRKREVVKTRKANEYIKLRQSIIDAYGGECVCCKETEIKFLAIDHIHNDGAEERRTKKLTGKNMYKYLQKNNYPKDRYQLLCHNCNMAKGFYGICPHQESKSAIDPT